MDNIEKRLKSLKKVQPTDEWQHRQWNFLLSKINSSSSPGISFSFWQKVGHVFYHFSAFRPVGNLLLAVVMVIFGSWAAFAATERSLPGNTLYPVKLQFEKIRLSLTVDKKTRAQRQVALTEKRLQELHTLVQQSSEENQISYNELGVTVKNINDNLKKIKDNVQELSEESGNGDAVAVIREIDKKTNKISDTLHQTVEQLPVEVKVTVNQAVDEALETVSDTGELALEYLIQKGLSDQSVSEEEIIGRLTEKLSQEQENIALIKALIKEMTESEEGGQDGAGDTTAEAVAELARLEEQEEQVRAMIEEKDYVGALAALQDARVRSRTLIKALQYPSVKGDEEVLDQSGEAVPQATSSQATSTPDLKNGNTAPDNLQKETTKEVWEEIIVGIEK